jgi:hypothetical protein
VECGAVYSVRYASLFQGYITLIHRDREAGGAAKVFVINLPDYTASHSTKKVIFTFKVSRTSNPTKLYTSEKRYHAVSPGKQLQTFGQASCLHLQGLALKKQ